MAPTHPTDTAHQTALVLVLSFASLAAFLSSSSHLEHVAAAARRTGTLTVLVRTPANSPSPWSASLNDASGSSSSSSTSSAPPPLSPSPVQLWLPLERAIARVYSAASKVFLADGRVLAAVDVVLEQMRVLPFCIPNGTDVVRWDVEEDTEDSVESTWEQGEWRDAYEVVALGGTFDHLHAGHKILLSMACAITTRKLVVGVSDDVLLKNKKHAQYLESLAQRTLAVERFIELLRPTVQHDVVPLQDVYGPTAYDPEIGALVVSDETRAGGDTINRLRAAEKGLSKLDVHVINLVADDAESASSDSPAPAVKVEAAAKMGSTGIREWMAKQEARSADGTSTARKA
ncbi:hypothetical protein JCM10213_009215 [Rhodosporidiobolus nylandii]